MEHTQGDVEAMHHLWGVTSLHLKKAMLKTKSICMHVLPVRFIWKGLEHMCHLATSFEKGLENLTLHYAPPNTPWKKTFVIWKGRPQNVWRRCTWYIPTTLKTESEKLSSHIFYPQKGYHTLEQFTTRQQKKNSHWKGELYSRMWQPEEEPFQIQTTLSITFWMAGR
jgi:hypothetical protein